jgi:putative membrane protein
MDFLLLQENFSDAARPFIRGPRLPGFGPFEIVIMQILIIAAALLILWWMLRGHYKKSMFSSSDKPIDILNKRYAAGQIKKEDYERLKKDIGA